MRRAATVIASIAALVGSLLLPSSTPLLAARTLTSNLPLPGSWICSGGDTSPGCTTDSLTPMPSPRSGFGEVAGPNGLIYVIGGWSGSSTVDTVEAYDPTANTWTTKAPMPTPRSGCKAVLAPDGLIYVIGGTTSPPYPVDTVEAYNPATDTWTTKASMPTARDGVGVAVGSDGLIYAIGGDTIEGKTPTDLDTVEAYNPATNSWTTRAPLPTPLDGLAAVAYPNGLIYTVGGFTGPNTSSVEAYNPATNTWATKSPMPTYATVSAAVIGADGLIYAVGLWRTTALADVETYNPATDVWNTKTSLPTIRTALGAAVEPNGLIYVIGGAVGSTMFNTVEAYNPNSAVSPTPTPAPVPTSTATSQRTPSNSTRPLVIPKTTKVLGASALKHLVPSQREKALNASAAHLTLVFTHPGTTLRALKPGNTIVVGITPQTPLGMMRKVTRVTMVQPHMERLAVVFGSSQQQSLDLEEKVDTTSANFRDALGNQDISVDDTEELSCPTYQKAIPLLDHGSNVGVNATVSFCLSSAWIVFHSHQGFHDFFLMVTPQEQVHAEVTASASADKELSNEVPVHGDIKVPLGAPGFFLVLSMSFDVTLHYHADGAVTVGVTQQGSGSFCTTYGANGWAWATGDNCADGHDIGDALSNNVYLDPANPQVDVNTGVSLSAGPHMQFLIDGAFGPDIGIEGYGNLTTQGSNWNLDRGVQVIGKGRANFLVGHVDTEQFQLLNFPLSPSLSGTIPGTNPPTPTPTLAPPTVTIDRTPTSPAITTDSPKCASGKSPSGNTTPVTLCLSAAVSSGGQVTLTATANQAVSGSEVLDIDEIGSGPNLRAECQQTTTCSYIISSSPPGTRRFRAEIWAEVGGIVGVETIVSTDEFDITWR